MAQPCGFMGREIGSKGLRNSPELVLPLQGPKRRSCNLGLSLPLGARGVNVSLLPCLGAQVMCGGGRGESAIRVPGKNRTNRKLVQEQDKWAMDTSLETQQPLVLILGSFPWRLPQAGVPLSCCTLPAAFWLLMPGMRLRLDQLDTCGPAITPG